MGKTVGAFSLLVAGVSSAVGVLWTIFKTTGGEWDYCHGGGCTSGYVGAAVLVGLGVVFGLIGFRLLRRQRNGSGSEGA